MGLLNRFKNTKRTLTIEQLIQEEYEQKYLAECKYIWKTFVPKSGQSDTLQGELLRELEKLRCEAQDNGNMNWDEDFVYFCNFIKETLCSKDIFSVDEKQRIILALDYIKECGNYAKQWNNGQIPEVEVNMDKVAYTGDNLYDIVADAIGLLQSRISTPIPYEKNDNIKR